MVDDLLEQLFSKVSEYCSREEVQQKMTQTLETFISLRFTWLLRCFEIIASLAIVQTLLLGYILFSLHVKRSPINC